MARNRHGYGYDLGSSLGQRPQITKTRKASFTFSLSDKMVDQRYTIYGFSGTEKTIAFNHRLTRTPSPACRRMEPGWRICRIGAAKRRSTSAGSMALKKPKLLIRNRFQAYRMSPDGKWIGYEARVPAKPDWAPKMPESRPARSGRPSHRGDKTALA